MQFELSNRARTYQEKPLAFMDECIYPPGEGHKRTSAQVELRRIDHGSTKKQ